MSKPLEFTDANFETEVLKSDQPVLVDFLGALVWSLPHYRSGHRRNRCRLCRKVQVGKVNTDENMQISTTYGIRSIPTLGIFKDGELVDSVIGALPKKSITQKMDSHLVTS